MKRFDLGIVITATVIVAGGIGFTLGHFVFKPTAPATANAGAGSSNQGRGGTQGGGRFGNGGARPTFGTVASISGDTITITGRDGNPVTVKVTSSTTYTNGSNAATLADVTAGATVAAMGSTASDGTVTATRVLINPSFGGGQGGGSGQNSGSL